MTLVRLRAREPEDAEALHRWQSDPDTMRWWDRVYPPLPTEAYAARIASSPAPSFGEQSYSIVALDTGAHIGAGGLFRISPEHRHAELSVLIGEASYRGRGYGTDATRALCRLAFDRMNLVRVSLTVFPENVAARRAYERVGFVEEGVQRRAMWKRGAWHDLVHMALLREEHHADADDAREGA
jgi:RimJ/RimL family protein N-acetyltransferase